jgi:hypothetical protein
MAGVTGRETRGFAFAKFTANSWGVAASVTKGLLWTSDGGLAHAPSFVEDRSLGQSFLGPSAQGDFAPVDLNPGGQARYDDQHYILEACAMGSPATVTLSSSAVGQTTSWLHVFDPAPSIDGLGVTLALDRKLYIEELTSAKVYGFGETVGENGIINETFNLLGGKTTNQSSVNINSTVYGSSYPSLGSKIFRNQGVFRLNAQAGGALAASDAQQVSQFTFTWQRPQDRSFAYGSNYLIEPADNEFPMPTIDVTYPRMNTTSANSLFAALRDFSAYKADLTYSGAFINSTDRQTKHYQFPYLELQDFKTPQAGAGQTMPTARFVAKLPSAAPTGMTGVTMPFRLRYIKVNSVNAFA